MVTWCAWFQFMYQGYSWPQTWNNDIFSSFQEMEIPN
jgi:hypothetical protein